MGGKAAQDGDKAFANFTIMLTCQFCWRTNSVDAMVIRVPADYHKLLLQNVVWFLSRDQAPGRLKMSRL